MPDRLTELLMKAVRHLDADEQAEVLATMLTGRLSGGPPAAPLQLSWSSGQPLLHQLRNAEVRSAEGGFTSAPDSGDLKVLPVRLPAADYERLREWSRAHGFSMAVIIRTLVERFLNDQQRRTSPAEPAD